MSPRAAVGPICVVFSISIACGGKIAEDPLGSTRDVGNRESDDVSPSPSPSPLPVPTSSSSSTPTKSASLEPRAPGAGGSYPYCEAIKPGGASTYCPANAGGGQSYFIWHTDREETRWCQGDVRGTVMTDCNTCQCHIGCSEATPCPAPPSGTSTPQCVGITSSQSTGTCILPCDAGQTCPDGMTCVSSPEHKWLSCAWVR